MDRLTSSKAPLTSPHHSDGGLKQPDVVEAVGHPLLRLQQAIGNQAVQRLVRAATDVASGVTPYSPQARAGQRDVTHWLRMSTPGLIIQRQPTTAYGLATASSQKKYVDKAVDLWKNNKSMTIEKFADTVMQEIEKELLGQGVPELKWKMVPGLDVSGLFDQEKWIVKIDPKEFSSRDAVRKKNPKKVTLKDLDDKEVREVVGTLYHESRHVDQDVLIIRVLLGQKKSVKQIVKEAKYPERIVTAVQGTKFKTPVDKTQQAHAIRMFDVMYGAHNELMTLLMKNAKTVAGVQELANAGNAADLKKAKAHVAMLEKWTKNVLDPKVKKLKALTGATAQEAQLATDLGELNMATATLLTAFAAASKAPKNQKALEDLQNSTVAWQEKLMAAYTNLEGEKDAFDVEDMVKKAFETQAAAP